MNIYDCNLRMTLNDARVILHFHFVELTYCDVHTMDGFYDPVLAYANHELYDHVIDECNATAFAPDYDNHQRFLDAKFVKELGAFVCALHVVNRALPVTARHAKRSREQFSEIMWVAYQMLELKTDPLFKMIPVFIIPSDEGFSP